MPCTYIFPYNRNKSSMNEDFHNSGMEADLQETEIDGCSTYETHE